MEIHVGRRIERTNDATGETEISLKDSKTGCVFFAKPGSFKQLAIESGVPVDELSVFNDENDESDKKKEARSKLEDKLYNKCHETKMVEVRNGFVTYCKHFKYLGS